MTTVSRSQVAAARDAGDGLAVGRQVFRSHLVDRYSGAKMLWIYCFVGVSRVSRKWAGKSMRNANKSPKIPYSALVREVEKGSGIRIRDRITTKS